MSVLVPYRSHRPLAGLGGESSATDYAQAIYQAISGDTTGAAYTAALAYAGPIAAIGNAIADFFNKSGDKKSAGTQALYDALAVAPGWTFAPGRIPTLITPTCRSLRMDGAARAVSEAIRLQKSPTEVGEAMRAWMATSKPWFGRCNGPPTTPAALASTPAPSAASVASASPAVVAPPVEIPAPAPVTPQVVFAPASPVTPAVLPATLEAPAITVSVPASVPPDRTPQLISQLLAQGASQDQVFQAALTSLAARGVRASPQVQTTVARDVTRAASGLSAGMGVFILAALFGFSYILGSAR